ncbi:MAG: hypothetical protein ACJAVI_000295 [Candidatus Azotimanducaceae bacterium]|jgi:hypothetical protein
MKRQRVMSDLKFAGLWAIVGLVIGFSAFAMSYWFSDGPIPGYKFLAGPGVLTLRMFSEEISFWPKLSLMMFGQYLVYFVAILIIRRVVRVSLNEGQ